MVAGLKFLSKKAFNPQNQSNQKRVWEREQLAQQEATKLKERNEQLKRERDDEELALARGDSLKVQFLYQAPPGLEGAAKKNCHDEDDSRKPAAAPDDILATHRQPGDDDAAATFRALLAGELPEESTNVSKISEGNQQKEFSFALFGSDVDPSSREKDTRKRETNTMTALEKAAGRAAKRETLTLESQIERFPSLATAPRAKGISSDNVGVNFKPLGAQIRNVKCLACGTWGHARGERECPKTGWNPFDLSTMRHDDEPSFTGQGQDEVTSRKGNGSSTYTRHDSDSSSSRDKRRKRKHKSSSRHRAAGDSSDSDESRNKRKHKRKKHKSHHRQHARKRDTK